MRALRPFERFHVRVTALYAGAVLIVLGVLAATIYRSRVEADIEALRTRLVTTAATIAATADGDAILALPYEAKDSPPQRALTRAFHAVCATDPDIVNAYVLRPTERREVMRFFVDVSLTGSTVDLAEPGEPYEVTAPRLFDAATGAVADDTAIRDAYGYTLSGYAPIRGRDGRLAAIIGIDVYAKRIARIRAQVVRTTLIVCGIAAGIMAIASILVARSVSRPLAKLIDASQAIAEGRFDKRLNLDRRDEFGVVSRYFDDMTEKLEEREFVRETFGRYVSQEVARALLLDRSSVRLGGEERIVTILFSDIEGYSTIAEHLDPRSVVTVLNAYLGAMNEILDDFRGCVIEILGDAILAVFNAPSDLPHHADQAVRCAAAMRSRLVELNGLWERTGLAELWKEHGIPRLRHRIGLHTGRVIAGNVGSARRLKFAVIGDTVNVAARLEALNKDLGTEILLSQAVVDELAPELRARVRPLGPQRVKGREQLIEVAAL